MDKTYRENIIAYFTGVAKRHKIMKYPCMAILPFVLLLYYFGRHFVTNGKRYASMAFVAIFFMSSCSFSFAVFAERTGFTSVQETYSAIVEPSDISLAEVDSVTLEKEALLDLEEEPFSAEQEEVETYTLDDLLANHSHEHEGTDYRETEPVVNREELTFDASDWRLVLLNKQHPIPEDYEFTLVSITSGMRCDERVMDDLLFMMKAAKKDGLNLALRSTYRTYDRQESNFNDRIRSYMRQGLSYMEAYKVTSQVITIPGCSEHEVGLALDITSDTYEPLKQGFAETAEGMWLEEHSCEYGFVLRYPSGKEYITGIQFEPWHFRYVGREAAMIMKEENLCLEEFWDKYL